MKLAHYIIFHPDRARQQINVKASALIDGGHKNNWTGKIWADSLVGNQDPYVFHDGWLFSYCHATQLRRKPDNPQGFVQRGSWLIFCSGDKADQGILVVDTVFLVEDAHPWGKSNLSLIRSGQLSLPAKYQIYYQNVLSRAWLDHFYFPFLGEHCSVTHTYESVLWETNQSDYSFLPYAQSENLVEIPFPQVIPSVAQKIISCRNGKYPVSLTDQEAINLVDQIKNLAKIQIIGGVKHVSNPFTSGTNCWCCTPSTIRVHC